MKFGFLSIQSGGSKRAPCDRYGFFQKSFQEFFSGYFLAFSIIDDVTKLYSLQIDPRYVDKLIPVFKFMSGIIAQQSEETVVSIVQNIGSILNETGGTSYKCTSYLWFAYYLINERKTRSGDLDTKLACTFGESLKLVDINVVPLSFQWEDEFMGTFLQVLSLNSTVSNLCMVGCRFRAEDTNLLNQALRENACLSSLCLEKDSIDDEGAKSLAEALRVNTSLSSLGLCENTIRDEGANSLAQALRVNTSLSSLNLCRNAIDYEGSNSLAQALRVNPSLSSLYLDYNSVGAQAATSLAQALRVNTSFFFAFVEQLHW